MIKIAHRGHSHDKKDNSIMAFESAIEFNFDMIEFDIQLTKDNILIIYHDTFINDVPISNLSWNEVHFIDLDIITLQDFFLKVDTKIPLYIDIKGINVKICDYIHAFFQNKNVADIYFASFDLRILDKLHELNPKYNLGFITGTLFPLEIFIEWFQKYQFKFICFDWKILDEHFIKYLQKHCKIFTYTCDNITQLEYIKKFNIDGIVSNFAFL